MDLAIYIIKRIVVSILTLLLVAAITFFLMNAIPGSPFMTEKSTPEQIALANAKYGLDKPLPVQFANYIKNLVNGDMGVSLKMQEGTSVSKILFGQGKFSLSIRLGLLALFFAVLIGIPLGIVMDERIASGHFFAHVFAYVKELLKNPEKMEIPFKQE